jgi:hypothetical protein
VDRGCGGSSAEREAMILMSLHHDQLVRVHDYYKDPTSGTQFIVMVRAPEGQSSDL